MYKQTILSLSFLSIASAGLNRPVWYNDGLSPHLDAGLGKHLASASATTSPWTNGLIPQACKDVAQSENHCALSAMEVFTVKYSDCAEPWVFCRCSNAQMSQADLRDTFAKIPVGLRTTVRHIMAFPANAPGAYAQNGNIVFFGDCGDVTRPSVMIHESAHTMDQSNWSRTNLQKPMESDKCVPDDYANTAIWEDFAQLMVVHIHDLIVPGLPKDASCMAYQLGLLRNFVPASRLWTASCTLGVKPPPSTAVKRVGKRSAFVEPPIEPVNISPRGKRAGKRSAFVEPAIEPVNISPRGKKAARELVARAFLA